MVVELSHGGEPLNIEVIIGCGSEERQILGEGRSVRAVWAPYIYGVRTKNGEGVLVQSPNICDRDLAKEPSAGGFPSGGVLGPPDAGNLEFLSRICTSAPTRSRSQKLKFHKAAFTEAYRAPGWAEMASIASPRLLAPVRPSITPSFKLRSISGGSLASCSSGWC